MARASHPIQPIPCRLWNARIRMDYAVERIQSGDECPKRTVLHALEYLAHYFEDLEAGEEDYDVRIQVGFVESVQVTANDREKAVETAIREYEGDCPITNVVGVAKASEDPVFVHNSPAPHPEMVQFRDRVTQQGGDA